MIIFTKILKLGVTYKDIWIMFKEDISGDLRHLFKLLVQQLRKCANPLFLLYCIHCVSSSVAE